eukprot:m.617237 g.617237  ORF g.617237 m.617237 type:complete len:104 (-) comp58176_c0_seq10:69-380(-)
MWPRPRRSPSRYNSRGCVLRACHDFFFFVLGCQLLSIESFQRGKYPLLLVPRFRELIEQMTSLDEDQLYEISKRIQPVNTDGKLGKRHSQTRVKAKSGSFFGY